MFGGIGTFSLSSFGGSLVPSFAVSAGIGLAGLALSIVRDVTLAPLSLAEYGLAERWLTPDDVALALPYPEDGVIGDDS